MGEIIKFAQLSMASALDDALGLSAQSAVGEELGVATFVPPQRDTNTTMFKWFSEKIEMRWCGSRQGLRMDRLAG